METPCHSEMSYGDRFNVKMYPMWTGVTEYYVTGNINCACIRVLWYYGVLKYKHNLPVCFSMICMLYKNITYPINMGYYL